MAEWDWGLVLIGVAAVASLIGYSLWILWDVWFPKKNRRDGHGN